MSFTIYRSPFTLLAPFTYSSEAAPNGKRSMAKVMKIVKGELLIKAGGRL